MEDKLHQFQQIDLDLGDLLDAAYDDWEHDRWSELVEKAQAISNAAAILTEWRSKQGANE